VFLYHDSRGLQDELESYQRKLGEDELEAFLKDHASLISSHSTSIMQQSFAPDPKYLSMQCSSGYQGKLCANCVQGYSRSRTFQCKPCSSSGAVAAVAVIGCLLLLAYLAFISISTIQDRQRSWGVLQPSDILQTAGSYIQLWFVLSTLPIQWPAPISWLPKAAETIMSSFSSSTSAFSCALSSRGALPSVAAKQLVLQLCFMVIATVTVVLLLLVMRSILRCMFKSRCTAKGHELQHCGDAAAGGMSLVGDAVPEEGTNRDSELGTTADLAEAAGSFQDQISCKDPTSGELLKRHLNSSSKLPFELEIGASAPEAAVAAAGTGTGCSRLSLASLNVGTLVLISSLSSLLLLYPTIIQATMSLFVCKQLDPAGRPENMYTVRMLGQSMIWACMQQILMNASPS
jgi:hypothetical protein